jgi:hypothetical protein
MWFQSLAPRQGGNPTPMIFQRRHRIFTREPKKTSRKSMFFFCGYRGRVFLVVITGGRQRFFDQTFDSITA